MKLIAHLINSTKKEKLFLLKLFSLLMLDFFIGLFVLALNEFVLVFDIAVILIAVSNQTGVAIPFFKWIVWVVVAILILFLDSVMWVCYLPIVEKRIEALQKWFFPQSRG